MRPEKRRAGRRIRKTRRKMRRVSEGLVALGNAAKVSAEAFVAFGAMILSGPGAGARGAGRPEARAEGDGDA